MSKMKDLDLEIKETCDLCGAKETGEGCKGCKIHIKIENKWYLIDGVTKKIKEVRPTEEKAE